jgi:formyltetrahydrofolate deformylase
VILFDRGRSARAATLAMGGGSIELGLEGTLSLQPLARIDEPGEIAFALQWITALLTSEGVRVTPDVKDNKSAAEQKQLDVLKEYGIDFIVLARYMQILSDDFVSNYPNRIINIHHSFLPAFPGARPYHSAYERGVKIIGATSHYVTAELDSGPIIEQNVVRITHKDSVDDLIRKGRELEKVVLSQAIWYHLKRKILVYGNRTLIFD